MKQELFLNVHCVAKQAIEMSGSSLLFKKENPVFLFTIVVLVTRISVECQNVRRVGSKTTLTTSSRQSMLVDHVQGALSSFSDRQETIRISY